MTNTGITIALILAFIAIVWMVWKEWRKDRIREERRSYRAWKQQDNIRWYAEQRTEDTRSDLIRVWGGAGRMSETELLDLQIRIACVTLLKKIERYKAAQNEPESLQTKYLQEFIMAYNQIFDLIGKRLMLDEKNEIFELRDGGMTIEEIAELLDISIAAVKRVILEEQHRECSTLQNQKTQGGITP